MTGYSVQLWDGMFLKGYGFLYFGQSIGKNIDNNRNKNLSSKCSHKLLDRAKQPSTGAFKTSSNKVIQKTVEAIGDSTGNKIADKITRVSKTPPKNNSGTNEEEILTEKYILPEFRQNNIDDLRLKEENL